MPDLATLSRNITDQRGEFRRLSSKNNQTISDISGTISKHFVGLRGSLEDQAFSQRQNNTAIDNLGNKIDSSSELIRQSVTVQNDMIGILRNSNTLLGQIAKNIDRIVRSGGENNNNESLAQRAQNAIGAFTRAGAGRMLGMGALGALGGAVGLQTLFGGQTQNNNQQPTPSSPPGSVSPTAPGAPGAPPASPTGNTNQPAVRPTNFTGSRQESFSRIEQAARAAGSPDPKLTASIAMLESGWLGSRMSRLNNPFGQTITRGQIGREGIVDGTIGADGQLHAVYDNLESAIRHHLRRWGSRYVADNPELSLSNLVTGGYNVVDPNWSSKIISIFRGSAGNTTQPGQTQSPAGNLPIGGNVPRMPEANQPQTGQPQQQSPAGNLPIGAQVPSISPGNIRAQGDTGRPVGPTAQTTPGTTSTSAVDLAASMVGRNRRGSLDYMARGGVTNRGEAWCAQFVNATLSQTGQRGTESAVANSFQTWGSAVQPDQVRPGDVVLQTRGRAANQVGGHVGIATGVVRDGQIEMIAGNSGGGQVRRYFVPVDSNLMVRRGAGAGGLPFNANSVQPGSDLPGSRPNVNEQQGGPGGAAQQGPGGQNGIPGMPQGMGNILGMLGGMGGLGGLGMGMGRMGGIGAFANLAMGLSGALMNNNVFGGGNLNSPIPTNEPTAVPQQISNQRSPFANLDSNAPLQMFFEADRIMRRRSETREIDVAAQQREVNSNRPQAIASPGQQTGNQTRTIINDTENRNTQVNTLPTWENEVYRWLGIRGSGSMVA